MQKTASKKWAARGLAVTLTASAALMMGSLPASAANQLITGWGTSPSDAYFAAVGICKGRGGTENGLDHHGYDEKHTPKYSAIIKCWF